MIDLNYHFIAKSFYPVRREGIRPNAPAVLIGSKQSVLGHNEIKPLEIIYTKRCNPDDFETITLKDWLKTVYDMKIDELENLY